MQDKPTGSSAPVPEGAAPGKPPSPARDPSAYQGEERKSILLEPPKVELPKGGGAIQGIGETFKVSAATGTSSVSIPLALTPSRGGVQPALGLAYDSGGGNGPFGLGWNVGIASISRRTEKGLPTYRDGGPGGSEDTFMLTGAEELVPALEWTGSAWEADTDTHNDGTHDWSIRRYRPRTEGAFTRIERWTKDSDPTDVHWRTHSRDNTVRIFGKDTNARVTDPQDSSRIFSWLLESVADERGNRVLYTYRSEDLANVPDTLPEKTRNHGAGCTWVYPDVVYYGNKTMGSDDWMFAVVFDYGDRTTAAPELDHTASPTTWPVRQDPYSTFKAGFDRRCYRLCHRVLVFHNFPDEATLHPGAGASDPFWVPVKSTVLGYDEGATVTKLDEAWHEGWKWDGSVYQRDQTAKTTFTYTTATADPTVHPVAGLDDLPPGVDPRGMQWVDLDGEGLTGMLTEAGGAWWYKRNEGAGSFAPRRRLEARPSIGLGGNQLVDLDRDGRQELVRMDAPAGFHTRDLDEGLGWTGFKPFKDLPDIDWSDPNLRQLDLDGDGLTDVLITRDRVFTWYRSKGTDGYEPARHTFPGHDDDQGPVLVFGNDSESIFLADMSGDGLTDIVRVKNGNIHYWPNLGHGRFGAKITMSSAPWFDSEDAFDPSRVRLSDVDGSGPTDLLYIGPDKVRMWLNESGNAWSDAQTIPGFPGISDASTVSVTDLLGTGTACLVWSSPLLSEAWQPLRYVDLMSEGKPHLMATMANGNGREIRFTYAPSTEFYLADRRAGTPWATRLSFPVQVVKKVESVDHITGWRFAQLYAYHHGFYDGVEREFRGFGMVETWDSESIADFEDEDLDDPQIEHVVPPVRTRSWFHTGAWRKEKTLTAAYEAEYWADDPDLSTASMVGEPVLPSGLSTDALREAARALRGQALRVEVYSDDGAAEAIHPYTVTETTWKVVQRQPDRDGQHGVYQSLPGPSRTAHYERIIDDPRVSMTYPLEYDEDYGTVLTSAAVGFPRRGTPAIGAQDEAHVVVSVNVVKHNDSFTSAFATEPYHLDLPTKSQTFELLGHGLTLEDDSPPTASALDSAIGSATEIEFDETPGMGASLRELSHTQIDYWDSGLTGPLGNNNIGPRALVYQTYQKVYTANMLSDTDLFNGQLHSSGTGDLSLDLVEAGYHERTTGTWWIQSGTQTLDATNFYQPSVVEDPFGGRVALTYDDYGLHVIEVSVRHFVDKSTNPETPYDMVTMTLVDPDPQDPTVYLDYRVMAPYRVYDVNQNYSEVAFDELGRVTAMAVGSKGTNDGDTLTNPTQEFTYAHTEYQDNLPDTAPNYVHIKARRQHATQGWLESRSYSDGGGNVVQAMIQAADGDAPERDANGLVFVSDVLQWAHSENRWIGSGRTVVDNKGNPIKQYEPFFTTGPDYVIDKELVEWGVSPTLQYDPLGRNIRTDFPDGTYTKVLFDPWKQETHDPNDTVEDSGWIDDHGGTASPDTAATASLAHKNTPATAHFDALGRQVRTDAHNGFVSTVAQLLTTTITLDVQGNPTVINDALGNDTQTHTFDMLGRPIKVVSLDAGDTITFPDASGQPLHVWKSGSLEVRNTYDLLRRPLMVEADDDNGGTFVLHEYYLYGDALVPGGADATQLDDDNLLGQLFRVYDGGGLMETAVYDFKGNPLETVRTFADDATVEIDWSSASGGSPSVTFTNATTIAEYDDAASNVLDTDLAFTTTMTYDGLNRVVTNVSPEANHGNGDRNTTAYTYDKGGKLKTVTVKLRGATPPTGFVDDITYDALGRRETIDYANGSVTTYTYDPISKRLTNLKTLKSTTKLQDLGYTYDAAGNIIGISDNAQKTLYFSNSQVTPNQTFTYDAVYRLVEATGREKTTLGQPGAGGPTLGDVPQAGTNQLKSYTRQYSYDAVGNLETMGVSGGAWTRTYTYDGGTSPKTNNRLTSHNLPKGGTGNFTHNARGAMTAMPHITAITRNYRDQMRQVTISGDDGYYAYDSGGQRVRKNIKGGVEETFYVGGWELYRKYDNNGNVTEEHETLHVSDDQERVALVETTTVHPTWTTSPPHVVQRFQLSNHLGTAMVETDESANVITYEEYHPYGTTAWQADKSGLTARAKRYRYTQQERDAWTGLSYHGARYYAPWLGRWESADPAGMVDGPNRYAYVRGNPVSGRDPTGLQEVPADDGVEAELAAKQQRETPFDLNPAVMAYLTGGRLTPPEKRVTQNIAVDRGSTASFENTAKEVELALISAWAPADISDILVEHYLYGEGKQLELPGATGLALNPELSLDWRPNWHFEEGFTVGRESVFTQHVRLLRETQGSGTAEVADLHQITRGRTDVGIGYATAVINGAVTFNEAGDWEFSGTIAVEDVWDFDPSGHRSGDAESKVALAGALLLGDPFSLSLGPYRVEQSGNLDRQSASYPTYPDNPEYTNDEQVDDRSLPWVVRKPIELESGR